MSENMSSFFEGEEFGVDPSFSKLPSSPQDLFSIFDALEGLEEGEGTRKRQFLFQELSEAELDALEVEGEGEGEGDFEEPKRKKRAKTIIKNNNSVEDEVVGEEGDGEVSKMSHIAVERNRRKQMNEHLSVLRSLMPCFYVKRGDQASIIGGVVDYINELQQVLQSLEAKKQRKIYSEVVSPRVGSSPRLASPQLLSPRKPPLSPRLLTLPISPRTPQQPSSPSPYNNNNNRPIPRIHPSPTIPTPIDLSPSSSTSSSFNDSSVANELVASLKSPMARVEVKFSGPNLLLKTISSRIPGQVLKIVSTLEGLALEILNINIFSTSDDTMVSSFTIKIGIECQLSAEDLAHQIQQTFCPPPLTNELLN